MTTTSTFSGLDAGAGALVVVDVQRSFGDPAYLGDYGLDADASAALVDAIHQIDVLVTAARAAGIPVAWVELASDPAAPWGSSNWLHGGDPLVMSPEEPCIIGTPGAEWYGVSPAEGEIRVKKSRYSGFYNTDLDEKLRAAGIRWVIVCGLTTECCVAATATDAMQHGYPVLVPTDAMAAYEVALHTNALAALALSVGRLTTVAELGDAFGALAAPDSVAPSAVTSSAVASSSVAASSRAAEPAASTS